MSHKIAGHQNCMICHPELRWKETGDPTFRTKASDRRRLGGVNRRVRDRTRNKESNP